VLHKTAVHLCHDFRIAMKEVFLLGSFIFIHKIDRLLMSASLLYID